jgi:hypothetical protein
MALMITRQLSPTRSFNETVAEISVYPFISSVLLSSPFILTTWADYFGMVTLEVMAATSFGGWCNWYQKHSFFAETRPKRLRRQQRE